VFVELLKRELVLWLSFKVWVMVRIWGAELPLG